jgi:hypothetical protein
MLYNALLTITGTRPSAHNVALDFLAVTAARLTHPYANRDGLILKAVHYHTYYLLQGGFRRLIRDGILITLLDSMHVTLQTVSPTNSSHILIETIDRDENFYEIPVGQPL